MRTGREVVVRYRSSASPGKELGVEEMDGLRQALSQAADIYFAESATALEQGGPFSASHFDDVSVRLGISLERLHAWLRSYAEPLGQHVSWHQRMIGQQGMERLCIIKGMEERGCQPEEITRALTAENNPAYCQERLEELFKVLQNVGAQRDKDRYAFLKELYRTREEIQHLRYELVAALPRRAARRSWWARLVGS